MPADTVLKLGDFEFSRFEVPEKITIGGDQQLAVHQLVGGGRIVDAMGRSDAPLSWSGLFLGENALARARYLDGLRVAGKPLILEWSAFQYQVVVSHFEADYLRFYRLPYRITCTVVADKVNPLTTLVVDSKDQTVRDDVKAADVLAAQIGDPQLSAQMATLDAAIAAVSDFSKATQAMIASVLAPIAAVQARVNVLIASTGNVLNTVTTLGGVLPNNPIAQSASALLGQVTAMQQSPLLYNLNSVVGRMSANLGTIGSSSKTITQAGGTLYAVAQKALGDATEFPAIAKANGLTDTLLTGVVTLKIPSAPTSSGGILTA